MARWIPNPGEPVGPNEPIARRLFDEPLLSGAQDQKPFQGIDLRHFEETRDGEISFDRFGRSGVERPIVGYLYPLAQAMGAGLKPPRAFSGWLYVRARQLSEPKRGPKFPPVASPQVPPEEENVYHAHVVRPDGVDHYVMALYLREIFGRHGEPIVLKTKAPGASATARDEGAGKA